MKRRVFFLPVVLSGLLALTQLSKAEVETPSIEDTTWTFTYLEATQNNRESLRRFVEENWFTMDAIAVRRGLFKSYKLIENITETAYPKVGTWDFIVAVEYFRDQSYIDISEKFEEIRSEHETVLIEGSSFRDLGRVIHSERVVVHLNRPGFVGGSIP